MKKIEVTKKVASEFLEIKKQKSTLFGALNLIYESGAEECPNLLEFLFYDTPERNDINQTLFGELWTGKAEYVVKEPLYHILLPFRPLDEDYPKGAMYIGYDANGAFSTSYTKPHVTWNWKSQFTEEEIKTIDERYWTFAVPVRN